MPFEKFKLRRAVILTYLIGVHIIAGYFLAKELLIRVLPSGTSVSVPDPTFPTVAPTPLPVPSILADMSTPASADSVGSGPLDLIVPVSGVSAVGLLDTYNESRGEDRAHDAIDIPAPAGTPVIAATDGVIARFFDSVPGGITIYQLSNGGKYVLYYAHLQSRADGLKVGDKVVQGQTIGYVGDTGNAGPGNFHLHFSVAVVRDPARYWEGDYINPYPLLRKDP